MIVRGKGWEMYHGDCLDVMKNIEAVDHVITDPPYSEHVHLKPWQSKMLGANGDRRAASAHAGIDFSSLSDALRDDVAKTCARISKRWSIAFSDIEGSPAWRDAFMNAGLDYVRSCVWDKVDSAPQFTGDRPANSAELFILAHQPGRKRWHGGGRRNVFAFPVNAERGGKPHPTTKPTDLMLEIVGLFTDEGETVFDPFAGSGTTGVAALRLNRRFIGIEKDRKYFDLCCERLRAEESNSTLAASRAGQTTLFGDSNR